MDSNQASSQLSSSPPGSPSSVAVDSTYGSNFDKLAKTTVVTNGSGVEPSETSTSFSSPTTSYDGDDDDEGFHSGGEEFETASERPVATGEETLENGTGDDDEIVSDEVDSPVFVKMPVAIATVDDDDDDVGKDDEVAVVSGGEVERIGTVLQKDGQGGGGAGSNSSVAVGDKGLVVNSDAAIQPVSSENSNLDVVGEEIVEEIADFNGDKEGGVSKSGIYLESPTEEGLGDKIELDKFETLNTGASKSILDAKEGTEVVGTSDSNLASEPKPVELDGVGPDSKSGEVDGVDITSAGDSITQSIKVDMSEPGVAVREKEVISESLETEAIGTKAVDESLEPMKSELVKGEGKEVTREQGGQTTLESKQICVSEPGVAPVDEAEVNKFSEKEMELVIESKENTPVLEKADNPDLGQNSEISTNQKVEMAEPSNIKAQELEADFDAKLVETTGGISERVAENPADDEGGDMGGRVSDEETDRMIFGSSEAAKKFIKELEGESVPGSHFNAESSREIDGQIVTDSEEEVDYDEEGEGEGGKELFDSAAFAALLKAATGSGSDEGGNITITSQDGSRLFSIERPAGLGSSARSSQPIGRTNRTSLFTPGLANSGESEKTLSEEEKKKLESLQQLRVKFLRLVRRLGASPEDSVAAQVLYRLALVAGRPNNQAFSLDAAKKSALELEEEGGDKLEFAISILVLGKSGVGKSSTINSIFGEEKARIGAFEPGTTIVKEITGIVDGVKIKVIDTPGLKSAVMEQAFNRKVLSSVKKFTKKSPPDIVLYVDRLDTQTRDLNDLPLLKTITAALGPSIWRSAIVTLTHGASAPPDGPSGSPLNYEVSVTQRSHVVQQSIGHAVGDLRMLSPSLMNPVSLVENHPLCRKNRDGQKVLPNGQTWRPQLLLLCYSMKILSEANSISKPKDPFDQRKLFGFRVRSPPLPYLLSSMLQTRAHPKLTADQGIENGDSDVDLADLSDSDQEEEEDDYDQLPPFKPLRRAQVAKLSKEQKRAYLEEYDYRVKLLQKKQWREERSRLKEMKKRGKDAPNEYGFVGDEADQEMEGPAPVATPLPDMVLPPSFDGDNPAYRYRFLEPTSQFLARPVLDTHGWDHDCGYDGVNLEQSLAIASQFPAAVSVQITKDKKDFSIHLDSSVAAKHGENGSTMAGFDIQNIGKQLAYIVRGETKFKNLKKNKTAAGISITFLGENVATGLKVEDQVAWGKQWAMVGGAGTVRCQGDAAYGANFELKRRELDYPIGQVQSTYGLSLIKWKGDWALGFNTVAQFSIGRNSKVALRAGINNKLSGQITARTSSSDHLSLSLVAILPIASAIYKKIYPTTGDTFPIY